MALFFCVSFNFFIRAIGQVGLILGHYGLFVHVILEINRLI